MSKADDAHGREHCPDADTIAALMEGTLDDETRRAVLAHVGQCDHCLLEISDVAAFTREVAARSIADCRGRPSWRRSALAAAAVLATVGAAASLRPAFSAIGYWLMVKRLVHSAPANERPTEARLAGGFRWAPPLQGKRGARESGDATPTTLTVAATKVLDANSSRTSANAHHVSGVANLILGRPDEAIRLLTLAAREKPDDPGIDSDLAAAHYERWREAADAADLTLALRAAERALHVEHGLPEALFNRALVIEKMKSPREAADAWRAYLRVDARSAWAEEAKSHLGRAL